MDGLKPLSGLTKTVVVMLCIYMFVLACSTLTNIFELVQYAGLAAEYYLEELLVSQLLSGLVAIAFLVVYIITGICFLKWIYRANKNLGMLGNGRMEFSPSGSVAWYFVPIACFFKPYQSMREIWQKAHKAWNADSRLLPGWWSLWIISTIMGQIIFRQNSEIVGEYRTAAMTMIVSNLIDIALSFTAIALLSNISRAYEKNYCGGSESATDLSKADVPASDVQKNLQGSEENRV